ncbi:MAG: hypothetical protein WCF50_25120 [Pseudolabrys sp.]
MFESSRFEAHADASGISLVLEHPEEESSRKSVHMRIHFELVADILSELALSSIVSAQRRHASKRPCRTFEQAAKRAWQDARKLKPSIQLV